MVVAQAAMADSQKTKGTPVFCRGELQSGRPCGNVLGVKDERGTYRSTHRGREIVIHDFEAVAHLIYVHCEDCGAVYDSVPPTEPVTRLPGAGRVRRDG